MSSYSKCKNCGADYGLHHYETSQCPAGGVESPVGRPQVWMSVTFEESANSQLEAELQEMKAERDALMKVLDAILDVDGAIAQVLPVGACPLDYLPFWARNIFAAATEAQS